MLGRWVPPFGTPAVGGAAQGGPTQPRSRRAHARLKVDVPCGRSREASLTSGSGSPRALRPQLAPLQPLPGGSFRTCLFSSFPTRPWSPTRFSFPVSVGRGRGAECRVLALHCSPIVAGGASTKRGRGTF